MGAYLLSGVILFMLFYIAGMITAPAPIDRTLVIMYIVCLWPYVIFVRLLRLVLVLYRYQAPENHL